MLDRYAWSLGLMKAEPSGLTDDALMSSQEGDCARRSAHPVYIGIEIVGTNYFGDFEHRLDMSPGTVKNDADVRCLDQCDRNLLGERPREGPRHLERESLSGGKAVSARPICSYALRRVFDPSLPDAARQFGLANFWGGLDPPSEDDKITVAVEIQEFEDDEDVLAVLTDYRSVNSSTYLSPPRRLR